MKVTRCPARAPEMGLQNCDGAHGNGRTGGGNTRIKGPAAGGLRKNRVVKRRFTHALWARPPAEPVDLTSQRAGAPKTD